MREKHKLLLSWKFSGFTIFEKGYVKKGVQDLCYSKRESNADFFMHVKNKHFVIRSASVAWRSSFTCEIHTVVDL